MYAIGSWLTTIIRHLHPLSDTRLYRPIDTAEFLPYCDGSLQVIFDYRGQDRRCFLLAAYVCHAIFTH